MMIETRPCGCRSVIDGSGHVSMVGTCPQCLPAGAITWLIENGRQLELFEEEGVETLKRGGDAKDQSVQDQVIPTLEVVESGLPF